jgi:hypothetical protein
MGRLGQCTNGYPKFQPVDTLWFLFRSSRIGGIPKKVGQVVGCPDVPNCMKNGLILLLANLLSGLQPEKIFGSSTTFWPRVLHWLANGTI